MSLNTINLDDAFAMLQYVSSHNRNEWISVGMSLKSEFGGDAFSLFDNWSQSSSNYNAKAATSVWRSFKGSGHTIATLIHLAKQNGYSSHTGRPKPIFIPKISPPKESSFDTRKYAIDLLNRSNTDDYYVANHNYAINKDIDSAGGVGRGIASGRLIGKQSDCIIVPIRNIETNQVQGVQCINGEGVKQTFGAVSGGALILGNTLNKSLIWYVSEGWASAYSTVFHHQNGNGVCACSFGKSNLNNTANLIAEIYKPKEITILQEDDS